MKNKEKETPMTDLRKQLEIPPGRLEAINEVLLNPDLTVIEDFLEVVEKYGTPEEINAKAQEARQMDNLLAKVRESNPNHLEDLEWLQEKVAGGGFISEQDYRRKLLGDQADEMDFADDFAVTLEISACQYFPWVRMIAEDALENHKLLPGRFIRVRKMKEQEEDGDLPAFAAAMQLLGASYVETLDTKGTDGSNIHLGGPETITGYFGGVGQPNGHALQWLDEYLYYYTTYGIKQVLNINPGTVLLGYMLHRLGVNNEFKISVYMGNDNPYAALWTLIGFNWSNSVDNHTMEITAQFRGQLGFEDIVRFEHHIVETYQSIVIQPYNRRDELVEIADHVANISAKHEGGDPDIDQTRDHPSDILDYFREKQEIIAAGEWDALSLNFMDKYQALNKTAEALTRNGLAFIAAPAVHHESKTAQQRIP